MANHYHVFFNRERGSQVRTFECFTNEAFASRAAANKWAAAFPPERRFVRACRGGDSCPGSFVPDHEIRRSPPPPRRRKPPSEAAKHTNLHHLIKAAPVDTLENLRQTLKSTAPDVLAEIERLLAG